MTDTPITDSIQGNGLHDAPDAFNLARRFEREAAKAKALLKRGLDEFEWMDGPEGWDTFCEGCNDLLNPDDGPPCAERKNCSSPVPCSPVLVPCSPVLCYVDGPWAFFQVVAMIFELVDATSEEQYYPLGVFFDLKTAVLNAVDHLPQRWDGDHVGQAVSEIRARNIGLYGGSYTVLWRGDWHYDYDGREWKLVEQQTGTLEKPLPITRA